MLNVMRKHAGSWMIKVVLFAIVIVFVFWGVGSFRSRQASKVAVVNDEVITTADYRRTYNNLIDQYRQRFGSSLNDGLIEMLQVKTQALNQLIDRTVLLQEAKKLDLRVSDAEIADSIVNTPIFQSNGSFDNRRYRSVLAQVHMTPEEFEAEQKNALLGAKVSRLVTGAAKVSDMEAHQWYDWQNTTVNVDYVRFDPTSYTGVTPTADEIAAYFDAHKEAYKTPPMVKTRYVRFDPEAFKDQVKVDDDEIAEYYDSHRAEFETEKTVEARHILIKVDPKADEKTDQAAKEKAQMVAKLAAEGQDFAELAKTYSEGPTKDRGGYLGKFTYNQMVKPFADKAFSMKPGEISEPVKTQFGWHIIKVESVQEATTKTLAQSRDQIVDKLKAVKARNLAYDSAERLYEICYEKDDLIKNAKTSGLKVMETGAFSRSGPEELGEDKGAFASAAFALKVDEISDVQEIGGKYFLIQVTDTIDAAVPPLEAVATEVKADLTNEMKADKAKEEAAAMASEIKNGQSFEESAAKRKMTVKQTGFFKRNEAVPQIGRDAKFSEAAFQLPAAGAVSDGPVEGSDGYFLLRLAEKKAPPADGFDAEKDQIENMLLQQKQRTIFQDWLEARKDASQIEIEKEYLE